MRVRLVALLLGSFAVLLGFATPVHGDAPGCYPVPSPGCYSVLRSIGNNFYGAYGTWNRAPMGAANSDPYQYLTVSGIWAATASGSGWIETGHTTGYFDPPNAGEMYTGYRAYYAYRDLNQMYAEYNMGRLAPNSSITDEFQISRHPTQSNRWRVHFNGNLRTSPDVGFWTTPFLQGGGEVRSPYGWSDWFNIDA